MKPLHGTKASSLNKIDKAPMIEGVQIHPLRQLVDERGKVMHMLRSSDPWFQKFGEIYFSIVYPSVIKGWHLHQRITLNYAVVSGMIKLALYDDRKGSPTQGKCQEIFTGEDNYSLITIPPGVWNGFKGIGVKLAIVANCTDEPHDPDEILRMDPFTDKIPYDWAQKHG